MSAKFNLSSSKPVSLEELIALNDEITALTRAGVPLELGLKEVAEDQPGTLGDISRLLGERMSLGESLPEALASAGDRFPKVYRAIVEAGLRAGRLPSALEMLSAFGTELIGLRRQISMSLLYPLIVIALAYGLFLVFILELAARMHEVFALNGATVGGALWFIGEMGRTAGYWAWIPPVVLLVLIVWWIRSSGAQVLNPTGLGGPLYWLPGVRRIAADHRAANFSDLLAMMVEHGIPLHEGIVLSAEATADSKLIVSAREIADAAIRGDSPNKTARAQLAFPPFLSWLMTRGDQQGALSNALKMAADMYRRRAASQTAWVRLLFPVLTGIVVGGGATLLYALTLFLPLVDMLSGLTQDIGR